MVKGRHSATATVAVIGTGDMGSAVGRALLCAGHRVITSLAERGAHSRKLAFEAGLEDVGSLAAVVESADVLLSIVPPAAAAGFARAVAAVLVEAPVRSRTELTFVDCNAVSPETVGDIAALFAPLGVPFADAGIVGPAPKPGTPRPTRFYVSGAARSRLLGLDAPELAIIDMGPAVGRASAIKMCYAALNKGTDALHTAILLAAEQLGVRGELMHELAGSQAEAHGRMAARIPYLAATASRYAGEMREIAETFEAADVTPDFHRGAEWVYTTLARTPLAAETRATLPEHRSLEDALAVFRAALDAPSK